MYTKTDGTPYPKRDQAIIEQYRENLENGQAFVLVARSYRSTIGYYPPITKRQWGHVVSTLGRMASTSDALAQIASAIVRTLNLYGTAPEEAAKVYEAAHDALSNGYNDVILRSGPEAPRHSDCQRAYTTNERIRLALWLAAATAPLQNGVPGPGWCLTALAREHGINPDCIMCHAA